MQVNGKEIDFRVSRLEDASRLELALQNMGKKEAKIKAMKGKNLSVVLKENIGMISDFFRDTTGENVLEGCTDFCEAKEVYLKFLKDIEDQKKQIFSMDDIK